jgi:hypothetical protein
MVAISRSRTKIWVVPANTAASTLVSTSPYSSTNTLGYITGEIKSYAKTGGENDVESDPVFGGYVDKEKPQSQFEVSLDIVPSVDKDIWEAMVYGEDSNTGVLSSAVAATSDQAMYIEAISGTNAKGWGFNNCNVTVLDQEHSADDNQTQTLNMKFSPSDDNGVANFIYNSTARDTSFTSISDLPAWTALDNN